MALIGVTQFLVNAPSGIDIDRYVSILPLVTTSEEPAVDEVFIEFTNEELCCLATAFDAGLLETLDVSDGFSDEVLDVARRGLRARRILEVGGALHGIADPIRSLLEVVTGATLVAKAYQSSVGSPGKVFRLLATPEVAVVHEPQGGGVHRFSPFATGDLLFRFFDLVGLVDRPKRLDALFTIPRRTYETCIAEINGGDITHAVRSLTREGVPPAVAEAFVAAYRARDWRTSVVIAYAASNRQIAGGTLGWFDAGEHGLWTTPLDSPGLSSIDDLDDPEADDSVTVETISAEQIAAVVLSYLPSVEFAD